MSKGLVNIICCCLAWNDAPILRLYIVSVVYFYTVYCLLTDLHNIVSFVSNVGLSIWGTLKIEQKWVLPYHPWPEDKLSIMVVNCKSCLTLPIRFQIVVNYY